jgi:hypothetical protein
VNNGLEKDLEGSDHSLIEIKSQHLPGKIEESHKKFSVPAKIQTEHLLKISVL